MARIEWKTLQSSQDLTDALEESMHKTVLIFKHSTRCSVSFMAKKGLETQWEYSSDDIQSYYLDLIAFRDLSNEISSKLGVDHESPQVILLQNGFVVDHQSHGEIQTGSFRQFL